MVRRRGCEVGRRTPSVEKFITDPGQGTRRFATPTDSVAAARSNVAAEMFRAMTRTVLFDHTQRRVR